MDDKLNAKAIARWAAAIDESVEAGVETRILRGTPRVKILIETDYAHALTGKIETLVEEYVGGIGDADTERAAASAREALIARLATKDGK